MESCAILGLYDTALDFRVSGSLRIVARTWSVVGQRGSLTLARAILKSTGGRLSPSRYVIFSI